MALVRGIQKGVERVVDELHKLAEKIDPKDNKAITEVATIAANNDNEIGKKLAEAMKKVGATDGVITIEEGKTAETEVVRRPGHAVRPRLPLAALRHQPGSGHLRVREPVHPHLRGEDQRP